MAPKKTVKKTTAAKTTKKPAAVKAVEKPSSKLSDWLLRFPLKFSGLMMLLGTAWLILVGIIGALMGTPQPPAWVAFILVASALFIPAFSICKLVKWLRGKSMDRRSFIAIDNGVMLILYSIALVAIIVMATLNFSYLSQIYMMQIMMLPLGIKLILAIAGVLVWGYVIGLYISLVVATYRRITSMGASKTLAALSIPFGIGYILRYPSYFLDSGKKEPATIAIKSNWFANLTNWVASNLGNAMMFFAFIIILGIMIVGLHSSLLSLVFAAIFFVPLAIFGVKKLVQNVHVFAWIGAIINIAAIITICFAAANVPQITQINQIEIVDGVFYE